MAQDVRLKVGDVAPGFVVKNQDGDELSLADFKGKKVWLSFHPLAWTGICTDQMKWIEDHLGEIESQDAVAIGMSVDANPSKKYWSVKEGFKNVLLGSDFWPHGKVAKGYGLFREQAGLAERANVLVDKEGKVAFLKKYPVSEMPDMDEILEKLKSI